MNPSRSLRRFLALASILFANAIAAPASPGPAPLVSVPRYTHPGAGQTLYFVLTDRFANGRTDNDTGGLAGGPDQTGFDPTRISHFHGGDFAGLTSRLDYLKNLGVTAIWVTPPFRNKPMQHGSAGYHGYWILDFLHIDPHLGTDAEFRDFVAAAHARGLRVILDIVVNHTADVIHYQENDTAYRAHATAPDRDASGRAFDLRAAAFDGLGSADAFPALSAAGSFAYTPVVDARERSAKHPAWLNDITLYHNRGDSTFVGESSIYGDFSGLDDVMTEHPRVVQGFIDVFSHWIVDVGVDGFRIDTMRHVNLEFWQAFGPAMRQAARRVGHDDFLMFGEVMAGTGDAALMSEYSTAAPVDATLDFGFFGAARDFVSRAHGAGALGAFFATDDLYTDHDSNVHSTVTFVGNHDAGRFGGFLREDNPTADSAQLLDLMKLGHGLLFLVRGQPAVYYGDEQGASGVGHDMRAREDLFASQAPAFRTLPLIGTARTGADDKFDPSHPLYRTLQALAALRREHAALRRGAMLVRDAGREDVFAFSRIDRNERVEVLVALNNSRHECATTALPTSQPAGATLRRIYSSSTPEDSSPPPLTVDAAGRVTATLAPLQFAVWAATAPLPVPAQPPSIAWAAPTGNAPLHFATREVDGQVFPTRLELRAEVQGGDGVAEVTFAMVRKSRPGQFELLGTDDAPPYRVYWRPTADLASDDELTFVATVDDLRGHRAAAQLPGLKLAPGHVAFGIKGSVTPRFTRPAAPGAVLPPGGTTTLAASVEGTAPLEYQWIKDDAELAGATAATLEVTTAGRYRVMARNRAGTVLGRETLVSEDVTK